MSDSKQIIAKLQIIEDMATEAGVKQLSKVMQEYIKGNQKESIGFAEKEQPKTK